MKGEDILCTRCIADIPKTGYHTLDSSPVKQKLAGRLPIIHGWAYLKFHKKGIVQKLLHQLKYNQHPEIGIRLGMLYGKELVELNLHKEFDLIVPVPLHPTRKRKRGYNQSTLFAEGLSRAMTIPCIESIAIRTKSTATQTNKSREERWENVKDAFSISMNRKEIKGKRILLVDDVITTGTTLEACGIHLIEAGCDQLSVACLAEAQ
ncbi:MAG: ComF family protein [Flammeovirgaceae bacterium]|nr:ComF family protein [Flammeovirgaceae bacterium]